MLGVLMIAVGVLHFVAPAGFVKIVPKSLPEPLLLVYVSGFFEVLGGAALFVPWPRIRRLAGWGLIALYVAVFPANVNMAANDIQPEGMTIPEVVLWLRLPLQLALIAWAWWCTRDARGDARDVPNPNDDAVQKTA